MQNTLKYYISRDLCPTFFMCGKGHSFWLEVLNKAITCRVYFYICYGLPFKDVKHSVLVNRPAENCLLFLEVVTVCCILCLCGVCVCVCVYSQASSSSSSLSVLQSSTLNTANTEALRGTELSGHHTYTSIRPYHVQLSS